MRSTAHLFASALILIGCATNTSAPTPEPDPEPQPDGIALTARFNANRVDNLQTFSIDAATGGTVEGEQGTRITFPANALAIDGEPVTGTVTVELLEVYDRAGMVLNNRSTSGVRDNGDIEALKSAGQFYINATQDGTDTQISSVVMVESRAIDPALLDPNMALFKAGTELDDTANWEAAVDPNGAGDNQVGVRDGADGTVSYSYGIGEFGWTNLDRWYSFTGELTQLYVQAPDGYTDANSALFLTYDGEATALASMDVYDEGLGLFTEHYGRIPVGQQVHFILVTDIDGQLHYAIQGSTITAGHTEVMLEPMPGSEADLNAAINALP